MNRSKVGVSNSTSTSTSLASVASSRASEPKERQRANAQRVDRCSMLPDFSDGFVSRHELILPDRRRRAARWCPDPGSTTQSTTWRNGWYVRATPAVVFSVTCNARWRSETVWACIHTVEVAGSNPAAPTRPRITSGLAASSRGGVTGGLRRGQRGSGYLSGSNPAAPTRPRITSGLAASSRGGVTGGLRRGQRGSGYLSGSNPAAPTRPRITSFLSASSRGGVTGGLGARPKGEWLPFWFEPSCAH